MEGGRKGWMIGMEWGRGFGYGMDKLEDGGKLLMLGEEEVYGGEVVGEECEDKEVVVKVRK